ncbi:MAG: hypothetical protein KME27_12820 [Lyngbya sp. HA4199-MV5]|nr:hypothetical protein [Lyngbya sp. HA4199-MV5]
MQSIILTGKIDADGHLRLDVLTSLVSGDVEVKMTIQPIQSEQSFAATYDFSDLAGTLNWQGDSVVAQRNLRDEWGTVL